MHDDLADAFVGYAPVLDAVVQLLRKGNLFSIREEFSTSSVARKRLDVLVDILNKLMSREQAKLSELALQLGLDPAVVYTADEQAEWLARDLLGAGAPALPWCPEDKKAEYATQVAEFLPDHPFRSTGRWVSPVFSAYVASLRFNDMRIRSELMPIGASTGLLLEFVARGKPDLVLDELQFAALHQSLMAAEWHSVQVLVEVTGADPGTPLPSTAETADGELVMIEPATGVRRTPFQLVLADPGQCTLTGPTSALSVTFPGMIKCDPRGESLNIGPDCFLRGRVIELHAQTVQVSRRKSDTVGSLDSGEPSVVIEATEAFKCDGILSGAPPATALELRVPPDSSLIYPWVSYRRNLEPMEGPADERAVRFLKMFMNLARRHGHSGDAAVFDKKLEGRQSIKGEEFRRVIDVMRGMGVVGYDGSMVSLNPEWERHRFSGKEVPGQATLGDRMDVWRPVLDAISEVLR